MMSALAKLYASRGMNVGPDGIPDRVQSTPSAPYAANMGTSMRRRLEGERPQTPEVKHIPDLRTSEKQEDRYDYDAALNMLENVNFGFQEIFNRLQKAESMRDQLVAECEKQDKLIQQLQTDIDDTKRHCEDLRQENADIAERLIAETARSTNLEHRVEQAEREQIASQHRIEEVEDICKTLHDGIYSVFGVGSPAQKVLSELPKIQTSH